MEIKVELSILLLSTTMYVVHALCVFPLPDNNDECARHSKICLKCGFIFLLMFLVHFSVIQSIQAMPKKTHDKTAQSLCICCFASGGRLK